MIARDTQWLELEMRGSGDIFKAVNLNAANTN